ncbi:glycoside hydrolase family 2 protein [Occultella glacieicola]|uniref:beta-mannosidase n=1 Tax=Occultella glacieicola TaxID=2518684 RepID=A0ABY2EC07_9MICO|nr:glycoside hydrolase family 2 TIM barrel-domain containing protein [Occultella glacieicola]TDE97359.1 glycoside hydrolase family 2 protein [Occultella glacieicola]
MRTHDLHDGWRLRADGASVPDRLRGLEVPVAIPGTSHTALLDAGLIPDPYVGTNEQDLVWMHRADWRFTLDLDEPPAGPSERVDLVFEGIDTVATVRLGAQVLGHTRNMHRSHRFDVGALIGHERDLVVDVSSALTYAEAERARLGARPSAYAHPLNMVRKMACSFGWDWGPDLQTAGLWRGVRMERWRGARLAGVRPLVGVRPDGVPYVRVHVDVERSGLEAPVALTVRARVAGVEREVTISPEASSAVVEVAAPDAALWWPVGHGEQPLHPLEVDLTDGGSALDSWRRRIGFRTVEIDATPDADGTPWTLRVNGRPVFVKGANWIPDDHLLTRITRDRLTRRLDQALGANLNLLRVWGGGIYESHDFYELCDERGLLVWQDFALACSAYPEEEPLAAEFEAEARENVARLTPHPSLVVWNGGNENIWGYLDWGWREALGDATWGYGYATELFPRVLAEVDPTRPYSWNSPSSPGAALTDRHPNDPDHGTHHQWQVWNRIDYRAYASEIPRFCSEFGFQGPPTWATLERAVTPADGIRSKTDPVFLAHQKADGGNEKLDRGLLPHLGIPAEFADWHWATQLNQARAVSFAIEHYRSWWPRTAGAIVWQLNDCWPVTSWATVDGDERRKPLWYALRHAFADRMITVVDRDGHRALALVNDTDAPWSGALRVTRETFAGQVRAESGEDVAVAARSVQLVTLPPEVRTAGDERAEAIVARLGSERAVALFVEDVEAALHGDPVDVSVAPSTEGYEVTVRARSLARDVTLLVDRLDPEAVVDDALVTLPAGDSVTFRVRTRVVLEGAALAAAPVLRTANDLLEHDPVMAGSA